MSRCMACNKIMSDKDLLIDYDLCYKCISYSNEARIELEQQDELKKYQQALKKWQKTKQKKKN